MNTKLPLVSVICLCFNQKDYVKAAIDSVLSQTYSRIELIIVDDGSTDGSKDVIREAIQQNSEVIFLDLPENLGNCRAFNHGFKKSRGAFIIDLAADDLLLPMRVEEGINDFLSASPTAGVHFSDAFLIRGDGTITKTHYPRDSDGKLLATVPQGNIYPHLIQTYFISPPTMMTRRKVFEFLNGYDESLSYEDFDFWIRSSREFSYIFNPAPLVKKRFVPGSHGSKQMSLRNHHSYTTFRVCQKIFNLNRTKEEDRALINRCWYEIRLCLRTLNVELIPKYLQLTRKTQRRLSSASNMER